MRGVKRQLVIIAIFVILIWMLTVVSANISSISPKNMTVVDPLLTDNDLNSYLPDNDLNGYYCCTFSQFEDLDGFQLCEVEVEKELNISASIQNREFFRTARGPPGNMPDVKMVEWVYHAQFWSQFGSNLQRGSCRSCNADCFIISSLLLD